MSCNPWPAAEPRRGPTEPPRIAGDKDYRIHYVDNFNKNYELTFYYKDNVLVYAKMVYKEKETDQASYARQDFYNKGEIKFRVEAKSQNKEKVTGSLST